MDPLPFNHYKTLYNLLNIYSYPKEEVLVLEAIANSIDANASEINISLQECDGAHFAIFRDNGKGMDNADFEKYHEVSGSQKTKGSGIGFAGVGAKIYLAAYDGCEIITITCKGKKALGSVMQCKNKKISYETTMKNENLSRKLNLRKYQQFRGTEYKVKVKPTSFNYLKNRIIEIIQFWFNYGLITGSLVVKVNNKKIKPWMPKIIKEEKIEINHQNKTIKCHFWHTEEDVPEDQRHLVYYIFGKRIKNDRGDFAYDIKYDERNRVFGMVDVSILTKNLTTNKEDFEKNKITGGIIRKAREQFRVFLGKQNLLNKNTMKKANQDIITVEFTKKLDRILSSAQYSYLNPWSSKRLRPALIPDSQGVTMGKIIEGAQNVGESNNGTGSRKIVGGNEGAAIAEDPKGEEKGTIKKKLSSGISVSQADHPQDPRESWVDDINRTIIYNIGHNFTKSLLSGNNQSLIEYNLGRIVIAALIKRASDQKEINGNEAMDILADLLHRAW